ncbi:MAG: HD domain-containing protein [Polyangiaceae bacterium]
MILRDPVHGLVTFESPEAEIVEKLLATKEVQRLRRIRQLGLTSLAFPGAEHTRFSHAIGAAFVMQSLIDRLRRLDGALPFWQRLTSDRARDAMAAALLHDLGHGPFSHLFEQVIPDGPPHEDWTIRIILDETSEVHRVLAEHDPGMPRRVADLVVGKHELPYLANAVSGTFDVDRCDYLLRDAWATGVTYGDYDLPWLLRSLRLDLPTSELDAPGLAVDGMKGITAIESFLLARLFMFQQVYFHKTTRAAEIMIRSILGRALTLLADGARLPSPATKNEANIAALGVFAVGAEPSTPEYLALDDQTILSAITAWQESADPTLADLSKRLSTRTLFKTIELGNVESSASPEEALALGRAAAEARGLDPTAYVALDHAEDTPFPDDARVRVIFPDGRSRDLAEVSFLLGRLRGQAVSRTRLVFAAELRDELRGALCR